MDDVTHAVATVERPHHSLLLIPLKDTLRKAVELAPVDSLESARLLCSYGYSFGVRGNGYVQACESLGASLVFAWREGNLALMKRIRGVYAVVDGYHMNWKQSLENSERTLELVAQIEGDSIDKFRAHNWAVNSYWGI